MSVVGVDGCRAGWFAVKLTDDRGWETQVFRTMRELADAWNNVSLILVDIPIGLRNGCNRLERLCDMEARRLLGPGRASSVFPVPCREALCSAKYEEASRVNKALTCRGLSKQSWAICPKIAEVDEYARLSGVPHVREVHPELCFWALNGESPAVNGKKRQQGFEERLSLLKSLHPHTEDIVSRALSTYLRKDVARDDILDALVAAVTALGDEAGLKSVPEDPETDSMGLRMEMVYRESAATRARQSCQSESSSLTRSG